MSTRWTEDDIEDFIDRLCRYEEELDAAVYALAEKHGIDVIYYKSEDREPPGHGEDGAPRADLTHTFQVEGLKR